MPSKNQSETPGSSSSLSLASFAKWFKVRMRMDSTKRPSSKVSAFSPSSSSSAMSTKSKKSPKRTRSLSSSKSHNNNINNTNPSGKNRYSASFLDEENWVEELIEKDDLILSDVPSAIFGKDEIYGLTITQTKPGNAPHPIPLMDSVEQTVCAKKNCLRDTFIVRGSLEHFAYVRTLRKIRSGREQRPLSQMIMLNGVIMKLSRTYEFPEFQRAELRHYKARIYEISRRHHPSTRPSTSTSTPESSVPAVNKKFAFVAKYHTGPQAVVKYRPSYSLTKVVTVFDEDLDKLVVKELPLARRRRGISKLNTSSSTSSTSTLVRRSSNSSNSSSSSLTTLADPDDVSSEKNFDPLKVVSSKLNRLRLSTINMMTAKHQKSNTIYKMNCDDDDGDDDDVSLFVLKEQFKYSGRSCGNTFQKVSSVTIDISPAKGNNSRLALTV